MLLEWNEIKIPMLLQQKLNVLQFCGQKSSRGFTGLHRCFSGRSWGWGESTFLSCVFFFFLKLLKFFQIPWLLALSFIFKTATQLEFSNSCLYGSPQAPSSSLVDLVSTVGPSGQSLLINHPTTCHGGLVMKVRRGELLGSGYVLTVTPYDESLTSSVSVETR